MNPEDWVDVEYVLRRMLRCDSTECSAFHSIGYIFFRSCAIAHVRNPSEYLVEGTRFQFPETDIVVEVVQAAPEGVLEIACYVEYIPV